MAVAFAWLAVLAPIGSIHVGLFGWHAVWQAVLLPCRYIACIVTHVAAYKCNSGSGKPHW